MSINITEIHSKSILRKQKKVESWFVSRYGMNLYRGCAHNCAYCDGRAEKYQVEGEFGKDIGVKVNAIEVLGRELDPSRKRKPMKPGFIMVGGGVCDSYQAVERSYNLTRRALQLISKYDFPVHMLTKSIHIERDFDVLKEINDKKRAIISMSFSTVDDSISAVFEPGVSQPSIRLQTLAKFKEAGFPIGVYMMPVLPFITDTPGKIRETINALVDIGIDFIIFGGMTMKAGRQQEHFFKVLKEYDAGLIPRYEALYGDNQWGQARSDYYDAIQPHFANAARENGVAVRIPPHLWQEFYDENDRVVIILEHIDYLLKLRNEKSYYGLAAYSISQLNDSVSASFETLHQLRGIGKTTVRLIREILDTGTSTYYTRLLNNH